MTKDQPRHRLAGAWRPTGVLPVLMAIAAATLLVSCSSSAPPASSISTAATTTETVTTTEPTTEPIPSVGADPTSPDDGDSGGGGNGGGGNGGDSGGTVEVKAPTLGSHFSGTPGWGPNDQTLGDLSITIAPDDTAHYNFGLFAEAGETGLAYGESSLAPEDGFFHLNSGCSGKPIATSPNGIQDGNSDDQCNELTFDPSSQVSAANPFDAVLTVHFQLTCTGQDNPTCRLDPSAQLASPDHPVVLQFTQMANLHGSLADAASSVDAGPSASASVPEASSDAPSQESVEPTG